MYKERERDTESVCVMQSIFIRAILYLESSTLQPLPFQSPVGRTSWDSSSRDDTEIRSDAAATGRDGPFSMDAAIP